MHLSVDESTNTFPFAHTCFHKTFRILHTAQWDKWTQFRLSCNICFNYSHLSQQCGSSCVSISVLNCRLFSLSLSISLFLGVKCWPSWSTFIAHPHTRTLTHTLGARVIAKRWANTHELPKLLDTQAVEAARAARAVRAEVSPPNGVSLVASAIFGAKAAHTQSFVYAINLHRSCAASHTHTHTLALILTHTHTHNYLVNWVKVRVAFCAWHSSSAVASGAAALTIMKIIPSSSSSSSSSYPTSAHTSSSLLATRFWGEKTNTKQQ